MKTSSTLLFLTFLLFACTSNFSTPKISPAHIPTDTPFTQPAEEATLNAPTPVSEQGCGFNWAYHDLPEITTKFDIAIKALNSNASAYATAFGEDCLAADGQVVRFAALETDFYVTLPVTDLNDQTAFGDWIAQVMSIVNGFSPDTLAGPKSGFVEFKFEKASSEPIGLRVPIQQYNATANGLGGEELFRMFYTTP